jgi:hypothetical protein
MNSFQPPGVTPPTRAMSKRPSVRRRLDPIDEPARPLGAKRAALLAQRTLQPTPTARRKNDCPATGEVRLASNNHAVTLVLRRTTHGLLIERTQHQVVGMRLVQALVFADQNSFDHWCEFEPLRFEDGLLFGKLVREGHAALAHKG